MSIHRPRTHYDIGSRVDGFISHCMVLGIPVVMIDIRPFGTELEGVSFCQSDATNLENIADGSIESLSALCSLEHFGLGRYGDNIDPEGCFKAFAAIQRVVKEGGRIYISLPVGAENKVEFNAHRIFNPNTVVELFDECILDEFSIVDLSCNPPLVRNAVLDYYQNRHDHGMGLFAFEKVER